MRRRSATAVYLLYEAGGGFAFNLFVAPFALYLIQEVGLGPLELVLAGTALELAVTLAEVPTGVVADTVSRRRSILIGLVLMAAGFALTVVPVFAVVLAAQALWGIGYTFTSGADVAWITDEIGEEDARPLYLRASQYRTVTTIAGLVVGAALGTIALWLPMVLAGALHLVLAAVLAVTMPETGFVGAAPAGERNPVRVLAATAADAVSTVRERRGLLVVLVVFASAGFASEGIDRLWQLQMIDGVGLPGGEPIVWLTGIHIAGLLVAAAAAGVLRGRHTVERAGGARDGLLAGFMAVTALVALFALSPSFAVAALAFVALTAVRRVLQPLRHAWVNDGLEPRTRATVNSLASQADSVGELVGGPILGGIAHLVSVPVGILAAAACNLPAVAALARGRTPAELVEPTAEAPAPA